jgi:hypothetical protein
MSTTDRDACVASTLTHVETLPILLSSPCRPQTEMLVMRMRHVLREVQFLGASVRFIEGTTYDDGSWGRQNMMMKNLFMSLEACNTAPASFDFCLIFQDDAKFHGEFWKHSAALLNGVSDCLPLSLRLFDCLSICLSAPSSQSGARRIHCATTQRVRTRALNANASLGAHPPHVLTDRTHECSHTLVHVRTRTSTFTFTVPQTLRCTRLTILIGCTAGLPQNWTAVHLCPGQLSPVLPDTPEKDRVLM